MALEHLKRIQAEQASACEQRQEIITRLGHIELAIGGLKRDMAEVYEARARQQVAIDKLTARVERIERHLELGDEA